MSQTNGSTSTPSTPSAPLWTPKNPGSSQSTLFRNLINKKYKLSLRTYEDLWNWSIAHRSSFWSEVWDYHGILGSKGSPPYVDESLSPSSNPSWFEGASLNWAENQLRYAETCPDEIAVIQTSEPCSVHSPDPRKVSWRELRTLVGGVQRAMRSGGVGKGDRVGWYGGNCLEAVVVLLATASLGGVFSSAAADFGVDGVIERLEQVRYPLSFLSEQSSL